MGLLDVVSDPRFQSADLDKQLDILGKVGASDEFITQYRIKKHNLAAQRAQAPPSPLESAAFAGMGGEGGSFANPEAPRSNLEGRALASGVALGGVAPVLASPTAAALGLVGSGIGGHVGRFLGSGIPLPHAAKVGEVIGSLAGGGYGALRGPAGVQLLAEGVPGYPGHMARAMLKLLGMGEKGAAGAAAKAAEGAVAREAAPAAAESNIPEAIKEMVKKKTFKTAKDAEDFFSTLDPAQAEDAAGQVLGKPPGMSTTAMASPAPPPMSTSMPPRPSPVSSTTGPPPAPPVAEPPEPPSAAMAAAGGEMPGAHTGVAGPTISEQLQASLIKNELAKYSAKGEGDIGLKMIEDKIAKSSGEFRKLLTKIKSQHIATIGKRVGDYHILGAPETENA